MERRTAIVNAAGIAGVSALVAAGLHTSEVTAQTGLPRFGASIIPPSQEAGKEKHVPFIDAPAKVAAGEKFTVTVQVGKVVAHPNTVEHHIQSIELYALEEGSTYVVKVATFEFGPTMADPKVTVPVMIQKSSTLFALAYCNLHGIWDNAVKVQV